MLPPLIFSLRKGRRNMHKTRLKRLADLLERKGPYRGKKPIPDDKFDMKTWKSSNYMGCGTTACAIGWAAQDKWFKEKGLKLEKTGFHEWWPVTITKQGEEIDGLDAVMDFFDLSYEEADFLFVPPLGSIDSITAVEKAQVIRRFIDRRTKKN